MRNALIIAGKEFKTFFQTPVGYVILFVFTLLGGWFFFSLSRFFDDKTASMRGLFEFLPWLFLVYAPAVTMRLWAEERRAGTIETLLTMPTRDWELVVGKYLAAVGLIAVWLLCLTPIAGVVAWFGDPDPGPILGGFIGALLLGAAYAAIGTAVSAVTENQIIALVVSVAASFLFLLLGFDAVTDWLPDAIGGFLFNMSLATRFEAIKRGVIDSRDLFYYLSFIGFFLTVNLWAIRRPKGKGVTVGLVAAILLLANYVTQGLFFRLDLTADGRFTLAQDTRRILGSLDDDLRLTAFLSSDVPPEFTNARRDVEDLVRDLEDLAGGHLRVEIVDPSESEAAREAAEKAGIEEQNLSAATGEKIEIKKGFLGIVLEFGGKTEKFTFHPLSRTLEYETVRRIAKLTRKDDVKVAWQVNDPFGGMQIPGMPQPPASDKHSPNSDMRQMDQLLKQEYQTTTVDLKSAVPDDVRIVLVCNADTLTEAQKFHLDQFLMRGGNVVVMANGTEPMSFGGMGRGGSPYMRTAAEKLPQDFFSNYGFKIRNDVVLDLSHHPMPVTANLGGARIPVGEMPYPPWVRVLGEFVDQEHPVSAQFGDMVMVYASSIELDPKPGVHAVAFMKSTDRARALDGFINVDPNQFEDASSDLTDPETYREQFVLGAMLEGTFQSYFVAHPVPDEVKPGAAGGTDDHGLDGDSHVPFEDRVEPVDDGTAHAKERTPADEDGETVEPTDDDGETDGGTDGAGTGGDGDGADVPGGGIRRPQDPADPVEPDPAGSADDQDAPAAEGAAPAPAAAEPEFEYLKQSQAPGRIFVFGTSDFVSDMVAGGGFLNVFLIQNIVDFSAGGSLGTLRARRGAEPAFAPPSDRARWVAYFLGWYAAPIVLLGCGLFVYVWRRSIRPAKARRRMAAASAA